MDENVIKKFENDSHKQRKIYNLTQSWFNYFELETIEKSLLIYYDAELKRRIDKKIKMIDQIKFGYIIDPSSSINSNSSEEEIIIAKHKIINKKMNEINMEFSKVLLKTYSLFIVNFSIEWEKNISKILFLNNFITLKEYKSIDYAKKIEPSIKKHFKSLFESKVYKDIKEIRKVANKIKHDWLDDELIINKYLEELLDIQINLLENNEGHIRSFINQKNVEEIDKLSYIKDINDLDSKKNNIKIEKKIDISFILKNFRYNINKNWIWEEFSCNMRRDIFINYENIVLNFIVFSKDEESSIRKNPKEYLDSYLI